MNQYHSDDSTYDDDREPLTPRQMAIGCGFWVVVLSLIFLVGYGCIR